MRPDDPYAPPDEPELDAEAIPPDDAALLAECDVDTFGSSGPGGQNVNKRDTAVRLRHRPTGIVVVCQDERSQLRNKRLALERLRERLAALTVKRRRRVKTRVSLGARRRNVERKRRHGAKKSLRGRPPGGGD